MIKKYLLALLAVLLFFVAGSPAGADTGTLPKEEIEAFITKQIDAGSIPGLSVTIVQGDATVYQKGFGYADLDKKQPVSAATLFELGSTSKAFTALAYLQAESQGLVSGNDPVTKYLPWFQPSYEGQVQTITLNELLHHTSGIATGTIGTIPVSDADDAIEQTARTVTNYKLDREPGHSFEYATTNYDVLALVLEKATGQPFESYMQQQVLPALKLDHTYAGFHQKDLTRELATGYKLDYLHAIAYVSPPFRGNTPAGYMISDADDIARWLKIQLGTAADLALPTELVQRSHEPDRSVKPSGDGSSYAAGWSVYQSGGGEISHAGTNPAFSTYFVFRPQEKWGVAVLANVNSEYVANIGQGIMNLLQGEDVPKIQGDLNKKVDQVSTMILAMMLPAVLIFLYATVRAVLEVGRARKRVPFTIGPVIGGLSAFLVLGLFGYSLYRLPDILLFNSWSFIDVWGPSSMVMAVYAVAAAGVMFFLYYLVTHLFPKQEEKPYLSMVVLSILSGFGNAFIIFVINESFARTDDNLTNGLLFYFGLGLVLYVFTQRYIRTKVVTLTNRIVYAKRMQLVSKLLRTSFHRLESLEKGRIEATLNNDTETVSVGVNDAISGVTNLITLICCFAYLAVMNLYAFFTSLFVILCTVGLYFLIGQRANKLWEVTRDIQNVFFRFLSDLTHGFKELYLHRRKREEFEQNLQATAQEYRDKRTQGELQFANVFVVGELLFTIVIGVVAFGFPKFFPDVSKDMLRNYIFVFLYMTGPVNGILYSFPRLMSVRISWRRIESLAEQLSELSTDVETAAAVQTPDAFVELQLQDVVYEYKTREDGAFSVGPINYTFRAGEIVFITGGNGSGKSTLAKLVTGLYAADGGRLLVNGQDVTPDELSQQYSAIFSDFHLFDRLYGIDWAEREDEMNHYLQLLQLEDKVKIEQGVFSTTKLSTGQKKRLALLVSYLEDRPICLFDEWAADQDPEYRQFFYLHLLPDMKARGKCVLAISHDDHYFHVADRMIKMDVGQIRQEEAEEETS